MFSNALRVVLYDSQRLVCEAAARLLADEFPTATVIVSTDIAEAMSTARACRANILVTRLPACDGGLTARLIDLIRRRCPQTALLCVADSAQELNLQALVDPDIEGCLLTCDGKSTLFAAIRALRRGERFVSPAMTRAIEPYGHVTAPRRDWRGAVA